MGRREDLIELLGEFLRRIRDSADPSQAFAPSVLAVAADLASENPPDAEAWYLLGWLRWHQAEALSGAERQTAAEEALGLFTVAAALIGHLEFPAPLLPALADRAVPELAAALQQARLSGDTELFARALASLDHALAATPEGHPDLPQRLSVFGAALLTRFQQAGAQQDLEVALSVLRQAVRLGSEDRGLDTYLLNLCAALKLRYEQTHDSADLDEAVAAGRRAVAAAVDQARLTAALTNLSGSLLTRFDATSEPRDLAEGTETARRAAANDPHQPAVLINLAKALQESFEHGGPASDLDELISVNRQAAAADLADGPERGEDLSGLVFALLDRFGRTKNPRDLDEAVELAREAAASGADRVYCLSDLCAVLFNRFSRSGTRGDLDEAASIARGAEPEFPPGVLLNFAHVLDQRARVVGDLDDLDTAIKLVRQAAAAPPPGRERPYIRLRATGIWNDRTAQDEPGRAEVLRLLSAYLLRRFEWTTVVADVDEAIRVRRQLAGDAPGLASLSYALKVRFVVAGKASDLDEALETGQRALALDPGNALYLASVSDTRKLRFERDGSGAELDDAVEMGRRATRLSREQGERVQAWANLSGLLRTRFELHRDPADVTEAVEAARQALAAAEDDDFSRPKWLLALAEALRFRIHRLRDADVEADRAEALRTAMELANCATASPSLRIRGARIGAWLAVEERVPGTEDPVLAAALLETAVHLIPEVAPRRMRHWEQRDALPAAGFTDDAAAMALLATDRPPAARAQRALSLLEAGRAVLLSQLLDTRGDLTDLRQAHPDLAARFTALRDLLDADDETHDDRIGAAGELAEALREIREQDGFASFALPPSADELRAAASEGPIVTLNVAYGGSALLLTADGIAALPLPGVTASEVVDQVNAFHVALREAYDPAADRAAAQAVLSDVLKWLWDNITGPVLDALGYHGTPVGSEPWPRCWWAPGGYLSLLPLHAAGHHDDPASGRTVLDRVVSSYTPTIRTLRHARQRRAAGVRPDRSLIVAMPATPGLPELRNVQTETELLSGILPGPLALTEPERDRVLAELPRHQLAHFACHGSYDAENPAGSRLLLRDHERNPLTVGDLTAVNLDGAQLAYLSACHTAVNPSERLLDEAMHLAGALQAAGFPQVVGTLWELDDEVAVEITEDFYRGLAGDGALDPGRAAHSLHRAVRAQRDCYPGTPSLWASHLHFGA
ncbi:CHAT domain-containing tetratricopeptide repeat protein [Amycolatopsis sp.]|uniref:CHAT domain-containing tetratricopeptide repeat protein n=1 Tax=Amycolatopsis sp. TaxID=37632 RepID=UPI002C6CEF0A|nr:CHAT domain-containing protein [Amycolatopsis sp.]HVV11952.1 CHAT domain-containing protein [Amycolatopsis sp.]